jgi:UDP-N-acetylmuramyl pentapeptide phosphotransferase/UDP-N-acetylglucosamine-1-phosphate transferase
MLLLAGVPVVAAVLCATLIIIMLPWLKSYAVAQPNARSSHRTPTPQGGGLAVIVATYATTWCAGSFVGALSINGIDQFANMTAASVLLAAVGAADDLRGVGLVQRLVLQCFAVGMLIAAVPTDLRIVAFLPWTVERAGLLLGGVWFVNLVNFMDGIDWMTVAEVVPITAAIAVLGAYGVLPPLVMLIALALLGATIGFAPFNRPPARLFLGDVGSLPIGLVLFWLLLQLGTTYPVAAVLLSLYYLADATLTLFRRIWVGEQFWVAHRSHFYQRALDEGFSVRETARHVFILNVALALLACISIAANLPAVSMLCLVAGAAMVGWLLSRFAARTRC